MVAYHAEARFPWSPGRISTDVILDLEAGDLPPNVTRELREGIDFDCFYHWEALGIDLWWWVTPYQRGWVFAS